VRPRAVALDCARRRGRGRSCARAVSLSLSLLFPARFLCALRVSHPACTCAVLLQPPRVGRSRRPSRPARQPPLCARRDLRRRRCPGRRTRTRQSRRSRSSRRLTSARSCRSEERRARWRRPCRREGRTSRAAGTLPSRRKARRPSLRMRTTACRCWTPESCAIREAEKESSTRPRRTFSLLGEPCAAPV
jgi:hypothetical protein